MLKAILTDGIFHNSSDNFLGSLSIFAVETFFLAYVVTIEIAIKGLKKKGTIIIDFFITF